MNRLRRSIEPAEDLRGCLHQRMRDQRHTLQLQSVGFKFNQRLNNLDLFNHFYKDDMGGKVANLFLSLDNPFPVEECLAVPMRLRPRDQPSPIFLKLLVFGVRVTNCIDRWARKQLQALRSGPVPIL